jgi:hypothetical protein
MRLSGVHARPLRSEQEVSVKTTKRAVSVAGAIAAIGIVAVTAVQLNGERQSQLSGDFRNAAAAEVVDAQGQALLRGTFVAVDGADKGEVERLAKLEPMVAGSTATGEAEVEYQVDNPAKQEVELTATGVPTGAQVTLMIDGAKVATATADKNGKVDVELEVRSAAAP